MKFKVYNDNGIVRITKIAPSGVEQTICSNVKVGEVASIDVEAYTSYTYSQRPTGADFVSLGGQNNNV